METSPWFYVAFTAFILAMLAVDLGVFHRHSHVVKPKEAGLWVAVWVGLALCFAGGVYLWYGSTPAFLFLTGYLIEQSLSVDNIFVIVLIFSAFKVPAQYEHRVLFWGIMGALVMRALFIGVGSLLIQKMSWIMYVFGAFLVFTGAKMVLKVGKEFDPVDNFVVRLIGKWLPVSAGYDGHNFLTVQNGRRMVTPLLPVLIVVEFTDLIFAVDSIPAVFAVTTDPFLVFTSNVFAILGLRSMFFLLSGIVHRFVYLKYALAFILVFVGLKMVAVDLFHVPVAVSLAVIALTLGLAIGASLLRQRATEEGA